MNSYIQDLDAALIENGEDIILRRTVGQENAVNVDVTVRARCRTVTDAERLEGGVDQTGQMVIISPTQINTNQWPGGGVNSADIPFSIDRSLPAKGDRLIINGFSHRVAKVKPKKIQGEVVRIEMIASGAGARG